VDPTNSTGIIRNVFREGPIARSALIVHPVAPPPWAQPHLVQKPRPAPAATSVAALCKMPLYFSPPEVFMKRPLILRRQSSLLLAHKLVCVKSRVIQC